MTPLLISRGVIGNYIFILYRKYVGKVVSCPRGEHWIPLMLFLYIFLKTASVFNTTYFSIQTSISDRAQEGE